MSADLGILVSLFTTPDGADLTAIVTHFSQKKIRVWPADQLTKRGSNIGFGSIDTSDVFGYDLLQFEWFDQSLFAIDDLSTRRDEQGVRQ